MSSQSLSWKVFVLYKDEPHIIQEYHDVETAKYCARRLQEHYVYDDEFIVKLKEVRND